MHLRGLENQVTLILLGAGALLGALVVRQVLPEQFLRDDGHLQLAMRGGALFTDAESFQDLALLYQRIGLEGAAPLAGLLGLAMFTLAVFAAAGWDRLRDLPVLSLGVIAALFVPALAYLGQYSKELVTLAVVLVVVLLPAGRSRAAVIAGEVAVVGACLAYGATLRPYWLIIGGVYIGWRVLLPRTGNPLALLAGAALCFAVLQPAFHAVLGHGLQGARDWSNAERADTEVHTLIQSIAPDAQGALGVGAALLMVVAMVLPWTLFLSGSPFHLASGIAISAVWLLVLVPVARGALVTPGGGPHRIRATRAAALMLAFLIAQALFEPDYGSALKHLTPLLPLVLLIHLFRRPS